MIEHSERTRIGKWASHAGRSVLVPLALCTSAAHAVQPVYVYVTNYRSANVSAYRVNTEKVGLISLGVAQRTGVAPVAMAVDAAGKFLYVANNGSGDVSAFRIDASTGQLATIDADARAPGSQRFTAGDRPEGIAVDPSGRFVYVANWGDNTISSYTINPATGALTPSGTYVSAGTQPRSMAIARDGRFLYVANEGTHDVSVYRISVSGGLALVESVASVLSPSFIAIDRSGKYAYVTSFTDGMMSYLVDATTGLLSVSTTALTMHPTGTKPRSIAIHPGSRFVYVANETSGDVSASSLNFATGYLTPIDADPETPGLQSVQAGAMPYAVAADPYGRFIYATNWDDNTVSIFSLKSNGALRPASSVPTLSRPTAIVTTLVARVPTPRAGGKSTPR